MDKLGQFFDVIGNEMAITLATTDGSDVSMRVISPVPYEGKVLMFTNNASRKYAQLKANSHCCMAAGAFFAEATAEFMGATMLDMNEALRAAYCKKFPDAFDEGVAFGGRDAEFILLTPTRLSGWGFADDGDDNTERPPEAVPTVPFDIDLR